MTASKKYPPADEGPQGPGGGTSPAADPVDLLNINEVAGSLRVSKMTVYRFIRDGRLPAVRIGNSLRVHRRDLDNYLNAAFMPPSTVGGEPAPGRSQSGPSGI